MFGVGTVASIASGMGIGIDLYSTFFFFFFECVRRVLEGCVVSWNKYSGLEHDIILQSFKRERERERERNRLGLVLVVFPMI